MSHQNGGRSTPSPSPSDVSSSNSPLKQAEDFQIHSKSHLRNETDLELRSLRYKVEQLKEELQTALNDKERLKVKEFNSFSYFLLYNFIPLGTIKSQ